MENTTSLMLNGLVHFKEGRLAQAKAVFELVARLEQENPYVNGILGAIYQKEGMLDRALQALTRALEIVPDNISYLCSRGEIYLRLGDFGLAAEDFRHAILLDPKKVHPAANCARLLVTFAHHSLHNVIRRSA